MHKQSAADVVEALVPDIGAVGTGEIDDRRDDVGSKPGGEQGRLPGVGNHAPRRRLKQLAVVEKEERPRRRGRDQRLDAKADLGSDIAQRRHVR